MRTPLEMVREWHLAFGVQIEYMPVSTIRPEIRQLRENLITEEYRELMKALENEDLVEIADGLADLTYVVYGTAISLGINLDRVFEEVHRSNMSKLDEDGQPIYREDGKVLKGPNFHPPRIAGVM